MKFNNDDWIVIQEDPKTYIYGYYKNDSLSSYNLDFPIISKIKNIKYLENNIISCTIANGRWILEQTNIKLASKSEIQKAEKKIKNSVFNMRCLDGTFKIKVINGFAYYEPRLFLSHKREIFFSKRFIKSIIEMFSYYEHIYEYDEYDFEKFPYNLRIRSVDVGYLKDTKLEDWLKIYMLLK